VNIKEWKSKSYGLFSILYIIFDQRKHTFTHFNIINIYYILSIISFYQLFNKDKSKYLNAILNDKLETFRYGSFISTLLSLK